MVLTLLSILYAKKGKTIFIRKIAGIDAINEAVGRATEMGRPVHFTCGCRATLYSDEAPQILAGLTVLSYISKLTARYGTPLIVTVSHPATLPLTEEIVKESYVAEGRGEAYEPNMVRYLSTEVPAFASGVQGILIREKVGANFLIGPLYAETLNIAETGFRVGAMQVGGTGNKTAALPMLVAVCDFTLIGEEMFAAGAYISKDQGLRSTILAGDIIKLGLLGLLAVGVLTTLASAELLRFLAM